MGHYGIGAFDRGHDPRRARRRTAVLLLARTRSATPAWTSPFKQSDQRRAPGHLSRQGPPALRWALYEAAQSARRHSSPDRDYYQQAAERLGGNRACLAVARKLLKRSYHTLRELGDEALATRVKSRLARAALTSHRCTAAGSRHRPAATPAWTASNDRAAAKPPPARSPHQPSRRRPAARHGRGPRYGWASARTAPTPSNAHTPPRPTPR